MPPAPQILYSTSATSEGGRNGHTSTDDGSIEMDMSAPGALGIGTVGRGANPEQLFAMGYATCYNSSIEFIAKENNLNAAKASVTAEVGIGKTVGIQMGLAITLRVSLPGMRRSTAEWLAIEAHDICPYSKAVSGNVPVRVVVNKREIDVS